MDILSYLKYLEEIEKAQKNRIIDDIARIGIEEETDAIESRKHEIKLTCSLHEQELLRQRLSREDPALQGGILDIF